MSIEAMTLLDAAKAVVERWDSPSWKDLPNTGVYINALRQAILDGTETAFVTKEWVGLTDEEIDTWDITGHESLREFVRAIEAKLKEKNKW